MFNACVKEGLKAYESSRQSALLKDRGAQREALLQKKMVLLILEEVSLAAQGKRLVIDGAGDSQDAIEVVTFVLKQLRE